MDDLISRQAAINAFIRKMRPHYNGDGTITACIMSERLATEILTALPSAQPKIIQCKDCKHWDIDWIPAIGEGHYCPMIDNVMKGDEWCCYGEREKDD